MSKCYSSEKVKIVKMDIKIYFCFILSCLLITVTSKYCMKDGTDSSWKCNYVPADIPTGISKVKLVEFYSHTGITINSSYFESENWGHVKILELYDETKHDGQLSLMSKCFSGLKMLVELKIHVLNNIYRFDPDVFLGLDNVKTLDLSGCIRLSQKLLMPTLTGSEKLPNLENLLLSREGAIGYHLLLDESFTKALINKPIVHLDVGWSQIAFINITSFAKDLKYLKVLNLSYSIVSDSVDRGYKANDLRHVDMVDLSHAVLPKTWLGKPVGKLLFTNVTIENIDPRGDLENIFAVGNINVSAVVFKQNSIWIEKCRVNISAPFPWYTKGIVARDNNVKRLDLNIQCGKYALRNFELLDIAYNGLEIIHPSILVCLPNLSKLDLSYNQLFKMAEEDAGLFEELLKPLSRLHWINLSSNNLETIPKRFFERNFELDTIDLARNRLHHVTFKLSHLKKLDILDLRGNQIQIFDEASIKILNSIHQHTTEKVSKHILLLKDNPICCSKCQTKYSVKWLITTTLLNVTSQGVTCINEAREQVNVNSDSIKLVQKICDRKAMIMSISIVAGVFALIICVSTFAVWKRRKHVRMIEKKGTVLQKLFEGQDHFEFVTFLSFSSDDKDFVDTYVYNQLNENLKVMTGNDRNLVCVGDEYLRPGFLVLDETVRCLERATVMIAVLSNNYCDSSYCHNELDQAYRLNKPILLMLKEHVDERLMEPTMRMLFKNNVRILWSFEDGEYVLKTTWKNVCTSILDLITRNM